MTNVALDDNAKRDRDARGTAVLLDDAKAADLRRRLDEFIPRLFRALDPPKYGGSPFARWWKERLATTRAFVRASARRRLRADGGRTQQRVRSQYETRWARRRWKDSPSFEKLNEYDSKLYVISRHEPFSNWFNVMAIAQVIEVLKPRRVLEVGCGDGFNSNTLSLLCPECEFVGLDLTLAGPTEARRLQHDAAYLEQVRSVYGRAGDFSGLAEAAPAAAYVSGDATALPFADGTFDLVFTILAVEQMSPVALRAFKDMGRVARGVTAHVEPFADFNQSPFRRMHLAHKDYFRQPIAVLPGCGLRPVFSWGAFPKKIHYAAGLVVAQPNG